MKSSEAFDRLPELSDPPRPRRFSESGKVVGGSAGSSWVKGLGFRVGHSEAGISDRAWRPSGACKVSQATSPPPPASPPPSRASAVLGFRVFGLG